MSLANDLRERERLAGNADDDLNVGQQQYSDRFNRAANKSQSEIDEDFAGVIDDNYGEGRGSTKVDAHGDTVQRNWNADESDPLDAARNGEEGAEAPWNYQPQQSNPKSPGSLWSKYKKLSPAATISMSVGAAGITTMVTLSPGMLLLQMKEIFHNDRADATQTNILFTRGVLSVLFRSGNTDPCGPGKSKISCKVGTMSKEMVERYKKTGFVVDAKEVDADGKETGKNAKDKTPDGKHTTDDSDGRVRYKLISLKFPNGFTAKSGKEYHEETRRNLDSRKRGSDAVNDRSNMYRSAKFSQTLTRYLKIKNGKSPTNYAEGESDEAQRNRHAQFNDTTGGVSSADADADAKRVAQEAKDEASKKAQAHGAGSKGGGLLSAIQAVCAAYKTTNIAVATVKAKHMARLANFAMEFLKAADAIKAGIATAATISYLSDKLTYVERNETREDGSPNPKYNLSATDSQGYRIAAHGDMTGLMSFAHRYVLGGAREGEEDNAATKALIGAAAGVTILDATAGALTRLAGTDMDGKDAMRNACRTANSYLALAAQCAAGVVSLATAFTAAAPGFGTMAGGALGAKICECTLLPDYVKWAMDTAVKYTLPFVGNCGKVEASLQALRNGAIFLMAGAMTAALEAIIRNWNIGSDTKGVDAGNAIAAGAGIILSTAALSYALKPGTKSAYKSYVSYLDPIEKEQEELARYEAKDTPFDLSNKYSFASTFVGSFNVGVSEKAPIITNIGNLFGLIPAAAAKMSLNAHGLYTQPVQEPIERYDCNTEDEIKHEGLDYLEVDGDKFCSVIAYAPTAELEIATNEAMDSAENFHEIREWMEASQDASEEDGGTRDTTDGCDSECQEKSIQPSIDTDGKPVPESQYEKYILYCTEAREDPWGMSTHAFEEGSERDQEWFTGRQCLKESTMLTQFRMWHRICNVVAGLQGTTDCYEQAQAASPQAQVVPCSEGWTYPTDKGATTFTSGFGARWGTNHNGVDLAGPIGTPIYAACDGTVSKAGPASGFGNWVVIDHDIDGKKYSTVYGHMATYNVQVGDVVSAGDKIAEIGNEGQSTGPHLHFEIWDGGRDGGTPIDPAPALGLGSPS